MDQSNLQLRFEVVQDGEVVRTEQLDQDVIKVGKLSSSHLRLEDANVSRIHAVIERAADGSFSVIDLGSATGTYVNGEKVTKAAIASGDELRFGDTVIRVTFVEPSADASAGFDDSEATVVTAGSADEGEAGAYPAAAPSAAGTVITLDDGSQVEPYSLQGYYDDAGNYIPGYYDELGEYHLGYGFYDEAGQWQVSHGYYDPAGEWVASESPVASVSTAYFDDGGAGLTPDTSWIFSGVSDREVYQEQFFEDSSGDTLEVAMVWQDHVLAVTSYITPRTVKIGASEDNDFVLEDASFSDEAFPIVAYEGGGYALTFTDAMSGEIRNGDQFYSLREAVERGIATRSPNVSNGYQIPLGSRTSARVDVGPMTFLVHFTDLPVVVGGGMPFDTAPMPYIGLSAVAHILFLLLAMSMPDSARSLDLDGFQADDRFVQLMIAPEQVEEEKPDWLDDDGGDEEAAAKHKGEEGKAGKEDSEEVNKELAIKGPNENEDLELKKARDTEVASTAGIAGELMVSSPWGTADSSIGSDAIHALGNLQGDSLGEARGFGGLGLHGAGRGGGGVSERGIGLASVGTAGKGGGGRGGSGYGKGASNLGERRARVPKIIPGRPVVQGSLDKEIIRRVVRQHRREIKYCYEQELQKNKELRGRVVVKFTISSTGSVVAAVISETTLKNSSVEQCMSSKIRRWVFPEPKGGGIVVVNYPFNLDS